MARIGVEPALSNIKSALTEMGHDVVDLRSENDARHCDCCIISGTDKNMMGIADIVIEGPVINADGATTDEVCQMVSERLS
ncbi:YkuS family protein [Pseudogracilibacillus auburnensis]|uniref:YkuS family protein n=1 Tax=Pseudogracilibacillus auburnensis TaxID=1494959 RepID=UPI001A972276|nr:YkuS family protein [Pseudogracilibacillus auburnensis]MBO1004201.1 YkuS family protein [Pseudogracilibacillus auburnensis]